VGGCCERTGTKARISKVEGGGKLSSTKKKRPSWVKGAWPGEDGGREADVLKGKEEQDVIGCNGIEQSQEKVEGETRKVKAETWKKGLFANRRFNESRGRT